MTGEKVAPYLPFKTFQSAVQNLRTHGLPDVVDRTTWNSQSGGMQKLIIGAFRFLGLIDDAGNTQPVLRQLVDATENSPEEKSLIASILPTAYPKVFELTLKSATPGQLAEAIALYGVSGATRDRAVRFFLKAANFSRIELSSRLTAGMRSKGNHDAAVTEENGPGTPAQPRTRRRRRSVGAHDPVASLSDQAADGKAYKTVQLRNVGGTLTLSGTFNPFELEGEERKLIYDITDLMKAYEKEEKASE
jgi:hypothetical protein